MEPRTLEETRRAVLAAFRGQGGIEDILVSPKKKRLIVHYRSQLDVDARAMFRDVRRLAAPYLVKFSSEP